MVGRILTMMIVYQRFTIFKNGNIEMGRDFINLIYLAGLLEFFFRFRINLQLNINYNYHGLSTTMDVYG